MCITPRRRACRTRADSSLAWRLRRAHDATRKTCHTKSSTRDCGDRNAEQVGLHARAARVTTDGSVRRDLAVLRRRLCESSLPDRLHERSLPIGLPRTGFPRRLRSLAVMSRSGVHPSAEDCATCVHRIRMRRLRASASEACTPAIPLLHSTSTAAKGRTSSAAPATASNASATDCSTSGHPTVA